VSLDDLARRVDLPRSTVHVYVTGRTLPPIEILDQIVIALGATQAEQARWSESWFRVAAHRDAQRQPNTTSASTGLAPRQLPSDVTAFTGRVEDLAELDGLLAGDLPAATAVVISAIAGTAGVGKPDQGL